MTHNWESAIKKAKKIEKERFAHPFKMIPALKRRSLRSKKQQFAKGKSKLVIVDKV